MASLGVVGNIPANSIQPLLQEGIHLRWAFKREIGFPWNGYYLFRRRTRKDKDTCLEKIIPRLELSAGSSNRKTLKTPIGQIVSDQNLVYTDDFSPLDTVEFDLSNRSFLRFVLLPNLPTYRIGVRVGFRKDGGGEPVDKKCINFRESQPQNPNNPLKEQGVIFAVYRKEGDLLSPSLIFKSWMGIAGLNCGSRTEITLPNAASSIQLTFSRSVSGQVVLVA